MNIAYFPISLDANQYINISVSTLKKCGCEVIDFGACPVREYRTLDAAFFNWYESVWGKRGGKLAAHLLIRLFRLILLKCNRVKIVFTFHNRQPHDAGRDAWAARLFMTLLCRLSDRIIILSKDSKRYLSAYLSRKKIDRKAMYIPHPNYIGAYSPEGGDLSFRRDGTFKVLFVGVVKPYKNIELIIEAAERLKELPIRFLIAGMGEADYEKKLRKSVKTDNVILKLQYVDDKDLDFLIRDNDILLLPYDMESSMNSGTVLLAFSNGRTVISPRISTVSEYDESLIYSYQYRDESEHREKIAENLKRAYEDWKGGREAFEEKGQKLYQAVRTLNSGTVLEEKYRELIYNLRE